MTGPSGIFIYIGGGGSVDRASSHWCGCEGRSWGRFDVVVSAFQTAVPSSKAASAGRPTWAWPFLSVPSSKTCLWTSVWTCAPRRWGAVSLCGSFVPENVLWCRVSVPGKVPGRPVRGSMSLRLPVPSLLPPWAGERGRVCPPLSRRRVRELWKWRVLCGVPDTGSRWPIRFPSFSHMSLLNSPLWNRHSEVHAGKADGWSFTAVHLEI